MGVQKLEDRFDFHRAITVMLQWPEIAGTVAERRLLRGASAGAFARSSQKCGGRPPAALQINYKKFRIFHRQRHVGLLAKIFMETIR
jgi:hypothetical protein